MGSRPARAGGRAGAIGAGLLRRQVHRHPPRADRGRESPAARRCTAPPRRLRPARRLALGTALVQRALGLRIEDQNGDLLEHEVGRTPGCPSPSRPTHPTPAHPSLGIPSAPPQGPTAATVRAGVDDLVACARRDLDPHVGRLGWRRPDEAARSVPAGSRLRGGPARPAGPSATATARRCIARARPGGQLPWVCTVVSSASRRSRRAAPPPTVPRRRRPSRCRVPILLIVVASCRSPVNRAAASAPATRALVRPRRRAGLAAIVVRIEGPVAVAVGDAGRGECLERVERAVHQVRRHDVGERRRDVVEPPGCWRSQSRSMRFICTRCRLSRLPRTASRG